MKAWWSQHYSEENKAQLLSIFGAPIWTLGEEVHFVAVPDEVDDSVKALTKVCGRTLVCPFTTPPQNITEEITVIHLGGHPDLNKITPTVELTWQLILRLVRPINAAMESVMEGGWDRFPFGAERMLSRMNLLVIGRGRIGSRVEVVGQAFGMNVKAMSAFVKGEIEKADIITLHTPPLDYHILGAVEFGKMKEGVYLVNTAQENSLDTRWLRAAMEKGTVAGAALDVVKAEHLEHLRQYADLHDNLILTPHIGGSTKDAWHETQKMAIEKALEYLGVGK